jgi:hypothetical protein
MYSRLKRALAVKKKIAQYTRVMKQFQNNNYFKLKIIIFIWENNPWFECFALQSP